MSLYEVNNKPSIEKIENYDNDNYIYYRFQMKDWEMGTQSWGMIYNSAEEAIENCEDDGLTEDEAVLDGKSACFTAKELMDFVCQFDKDFRVLVLNGNRVGEGHDGEDVIEVNEVLEIWDFDEFTNLILELEEKELCLV